MALVDLNVTENYLAFKILKQLQLNQAIQSIEDYVNTNVKLNFQQIGIDVFGNTYEFNNDGLQTVLTPLIDRVGLIDATTTVQSSWTFDNTVAFNNTVTFLGIANSSVQPRCRAHRITSNQAIADATETAVSFNGEAYDVGTIHDNTVNPSRMTIPSGSSGVWYFDAQVTFAADADGRREILLFKNGVAVAKNQTPTASAAFDTNIRISYLDQANAGDFYEVFVFHNAANSLDVVLGTDKTFFNSAKIW